MTRKKQIDILLDYLNDKYPSFIETRELGKLCNLLPRDVTILLRKIPNAEKSYVNKITSWRFKKEGEICV